MLYLQGKNADNRNNILFFMRIERNRNDDSYTKIVVVRDNVLPLIDEKGVQYINIEDFLLERINEL